MAREVHFQAHEELVPWNTLTNPFEDERQTAPPATRRIERRAATKLLSSCRTVRGVTISLGAPLSAEEHLVQPCPSASPAQRHQARTTWIFETLVLPSGQPAAPHPQPWAAACRTRRSPWKVVSARSALPQGRPAHWASASTMRRRANGLTSQAFTSTRSQSLAASIWRSSPKAATPVRRSGAPKNGTPPSGLLDTAMCHVSFFEAGTFAKWRGCRLPTNQERKLAAAGTRRETAAAPWIDAAHTPAGAAAR